MGPPGRYSFHHALPISPMYYQSKVLPNPQSTWQQEREKISPTYRTFGCCVRVGPPGHCAAKLKPNLHKGVILGYVPHTTLEIYYGRTQKHPRLRLWHMLILTRVVWTIYQSKKCHQMLCSSHLYRQWTTCPAGHHWAKCLQLCLSCCPLCPYLHWLVEVLWLPQQQYLWSIVWR